MTDTGPTDGMSAAERDLRERLSVYKPPGYPDEHPMRVRLGVIRTLLHDIEMWRKIAQRETEINTTDADEWGFDALVMMAKRILNEVYPEDIFTGESGDSGPQFIVAFRRLIREIEATGAKPVTKP